MIATSKQMRKLVRTNFPQAFYKSTYRKQSWTDKTSDPDIRRCCMVMYFDDMDAIENFAEDLKVLMFLAGYENKFHLHFCDYDQKTYFRFKAKI